MPRKIGSVTRQDLVDASLPPATATYTVISHNFVITKVLKTLEDNGFKVNEEQYRCTKDAQVASGIYKIDYQGDTDLGMMFAFGNSYDKSMRFKCAVGAYVYANQSSMISEMSDWNRKHTGTADKETQETIELQVTNAMKYFTELKEQKDTMKGIEVVPEVFGRLLGELYLNLKLLTGEQMAIIKKEYDKPSFAYTTGKNNLWTLYNHILVALKISHPRTWMEQQTAINYKLALDFNLVEFDDEVETADEKVIGVSNEDTGNAGIFLPNYHDTTEDAFKDDPFPGVVEEVPAEELIETYGGDISQIDSITIENEMPVDEALETYPEMTKEIADVVGVENEVEDEPLIPTQEELDAEHVGPPEMYQGTEEELSVEVEEIEVEVEIEEEEISETISNDDEDNLAEVVEEDIPFITDEEEDEVMEEILTEIPNEEGSGWDVDKAKEVESPQQIEDTSLDNIESTGEVFDIEEEAVLPGITPLAGLDEPVEIMSPAEAKEKSEVIETQDKTSDLYITIKLELLELYGYTPDFTYTEKEGQYNIVLESGETVVLSSAYIDTLND